jgi:hypothetical protein
MLVAHLHETSNPKLTAQIDTIGWRLNFRRAIEHKGRCAAHLST